MSEEKKPCDLCGLPAEIDGFNLANKEGQKNFCCEGCLGIYKMLNEENLLPDSTDNSK